ncbi:hypothetical protein ACYOEI_09280 [Singulisphaera rosea]
MLFSSVSSAQAADFQAQSTDNLSVEDLARALNVLWWKHRLHFEKPVWGVAIRPCELRRRSDGSWQREYLGPGVSISTDDEKAKYQDVEIGVFIPDSPKCRNYSLKVGPGCVRQDFEKIPDLRRTYFLSDRVLKVDGCLVLACRERDPRGTTLQVENFVHVIALEVKTQDEPTDPATIIELNPDPK